MAVIDKNHSFVQQEKIYGAEIWNKKMFIITSYLQFIVKRAQAIKNQNNVVKLHNSPEQSNYAEMFTNSYI